MKDEQYDLYNGIPPHQSHSETSREAALDVLPHVGRLQKLVLDYFKEVGTQGATTDELAVNLGKHTNSVAPRRVELELKGLIVKAGFRRKTRFGKNAEVYVCSEFLASGSSNGRTRGFEP